MSFPTFQQLDSRDCGPVCLQIICKYYGKYIEIDRIRRLMNTGREGSSIYDFIEAAASLEIKCLPYSISYWKFRHEVPLPCVVLWQKRHFVVVYKITMKHVYISDPAAGLCKYKLKEFAENWLSNDMRQNHTKRGICITCEPTVRFKMVLGDRSTGTYDAAKFFWQYIKPYKKQVAQITSVLLVLSVLSAIFPVLTQSIIDTGIPNQDTSFILLMLVAYISLSLGKIVGTWLHSSLGLKFAAKIKITMTADYLIRLFKMPMEFFETRLMGDIIQRNADFDRIETMAISSIFSSLLSFLNLSVFGTILFIYNQTLFYVFLIGSIIYVLWILIFWSFRKKMDIKYYSLTARNQSQWIEFLTQISDIKGYQFSDKKRWAWEKNQVQLYKTRVKLLNIEQVQNLGSGAINSIKDALLIYLSALFVIDGNMTLGMLTSVQYILGQLSSPLEGIVNLIVSMQLSTISYSRVSDIQKIKAEDESISNGVNNSSLANYDEDLRLSNVYFKYNGDSFALKNITVSIPVGKTTAIVGESGCGKSTLLKILSGLYYPSSGNVYLGAMKRSSISIDSWRSHCGVITQDSSLSRDTIYNNIVFGREADDEKVLSAVEAANIKKEIEGLPNGYDTLIGENGRGVSEGQKQRILLARALYDSPHYLFLDEMTSSLDVRNEESVVGMLKELTPRKTICIVSHRKETIMCSDLVIVMKNGMVVEMAPPDILMSRKGEYYNLYNKGE